MIPILNGTGFEKGKSSGSRCTKNKQRLPKNTNQNTGIKIDKTKVKEDEIRIMRVAWVPSDNYMQQRICSIHIRLKEET